MILKRITAGLVAFAAVIVFGTTLVHALLYNPDTELIAINTSESPHVAAHATSPDNYPVRLIIPSISVDSNVQYVGITTHGTMSVPNNFTDVGWYKYGVVPGATGSAVMAGHVDNALALPGVFKSLQDLKKGDDVYVVAKDGTKLHFVVDDTESYGVTEAPAERIFDESGPPRLNLVTCEGTWIQSEHQYDHRFVVYTHLVE